MIFNSLYIYLFIRYSILGGFMILSIWESRFVKIEHHFLFLYFSKMIYLLGGSMIFPCRISIEWYLKKNPKLENPFRLDSSNHVDRCTFFYPKNPTNSWDRAKTRITRVIYFKSLSRFGISKWPFSNSEISWNRSMNFSMGIHCEIFSKIVSRDYLHESLSLKSHHTKGI